MARSSFLSGMLRGPERPHILENTGNGGVLADRVELAVDSASRRRGLLGRDGFARGSALVIAPCSSIHTFFMRFDIDVVFVARDGRVLKTYDAMPRRRIGFSTGAFAAIEFPAGTLARTPAKRGDVLALVSREP